MTTKPDYARIAELERDIFGETLTVAEAQRLVPRMHDLDAVLAESVRWLLSGRGLPELAGSKVAAAGRSVVLGLLGFAALWLCLMLAGVVPWSS